MLGKMLKKNKVNKIKYGQMNGYFKGYENVSTHADSWNVTHGSQEQLGFFEDFLKDIEKSVDEWSKDVLPPDIKKQIDSNIKKEADKQVAKVTTVATSEAQKLLAQQAAKPENQDKAITSGIQAGAKAVESAALDVADAFRTGGIGEVFKRYPIPFYVTGGLVGLMTIKWGLNQIGMGKAKAVLKSANPKKRRYKKTKKK